MKTNLEKIVDSRIKYLERKNKSLESHVFSDDLKIKNLNHKIKHLKLENNYLKLMVKVDESRSIDREMLTTISI